MVVIVVQMFVMICIMYSIRLEQLKKLLLTIIINLC